MGRWVDRNWYRYLWHHYPNAALVVAILLLAGLALGGYLTMRATAGTEAKTSSYVQLMTTVTKRVPVVRNGKVVYRRQVVVKRIYAKPVTMQETRTLQTPGGTQTVTRDVVSYRPVYRRKVVLVHGKQVTVKQSVTDTRMLTNTQLLTVTNAITNVVTNVRTATVGSTLERTATVAQTATATVNRTQTVNQTATSTQTVTAPPETVVQRVTTTLPADTVTVTLPRDTVTITVTGNVVTVTTGG